MTKLSERIRLLRKERQLSQQELARIVRTSKSSINMYERGEREPGVPMLEALADCFNVDMDYLTGRSDIRIADPVFPTLPDNILPMPKMKKVPLLGTVACGEPILAAENIEDMVSMPENVHADFALRCKGDSMINARIFDGDIVYIRQQATVESGDIAAVLIGDEATLKRVRIFPDHISLEPENPTFRALVFWDEEMNTVRILGKAVAFTSAVL